MSDDRRHHDDPRAPRRRREDALELLLATMREQLDATQRLRREGSENFQRYRRRAYVAFAILTVASGLALYLVWRQAERIQQERERSIRTQCVEQNHRNANTIRELDRRLLIARRVATPSQVKRLEESRAFTVSLINALAPRHDCDAVISRTVNVK